MRVIAAINRARDHRKNSPSKLAAARRVFARKFSASFGPRVFFVAPHFSREIDGVFTMDFTGGGIVWARAIKPWRTKRWKRKP